MRYTEIDREVEALADRQHGAFARWQAAELGATDVFTHRRVREGIWARPVPGVLVLARSAGTWERQAKLAELSVRGSGLALDAAAVVHRLEGFRRGPIDLAAGPSAKNRTPIATVHRFAGARFTVVDGFRLTTVPQTIVDLAMHGPPWKIEPAIDDAVRTGKLTLPQLRERVDFYDGSRRPGVELVRGFIAERSDDAWQPPDSVLGAKLWSTLGALIAPFAPRREAPFPWWPDRPYRVDVLLPRPKIIIEADGRAWHARVRDFDRDRWRDNEAVAHGYAVLRFTWVHLTCSPNDVVRLVRRTLAERLHAAAPDQRAG